MTAKRWILRGQDTNRAASLARVLNISPIVASLLISGGCGDERSAWAFLQPSYDQLHDPYLMLGMTEAVARLQQAIHQHEQILIYGDYDVDGTTGTAVLLRALKLLGARVGFHVPHRFMPAY
jgi:single-stranded-DNA-specific exonuclease